MHYSNVLTKEHIEEQVQYFPNVKRVIDYWNITAHNLFRCIIVNNDLPVTAMPPGQLSDKKNQKNAEDENQRKRKSVEEFS